MTSPLGKLIRLKLVEHDMKRSDLAIRLGVKENTISGWITSNHMPENKHLPALAVCLKVSQHELLLALAKQNETKEQERGLEIMTVSSSIAQEQAAELGRLREELYLANRQHELKDQEIADLKAVIAGSKMSAHEAGWPATIRNLKAELGAVRANYDQACKEKTEAIAEAQRRLDHNETVNDQIASNLRKQVENQAALILELKEANAKLDRENTNIMLV